MKTLFLTVLTAFSLVLNAQHMEEIIPIQETITNLFVNTDQNNWINVEAQFAPKVVLDYSSMTGGEADNTTPQGITSAWKTALPGFTYTHHQIGNFITQVKGNKAHSFCYGTATHYLEDDKGNVWTVVGTYDFDLEKIEGLWKITSMVFNYKYQDGNTTLITKAIEKLKHK